MFIYAERLRKSEILPHTDYEALNTQTDRQTDIYTRTHIYWKQSSKIFKSDPATKANKKK